MITKLTAAQLALIPEYVDKYTAIGLSTARVDHKSARETARDLYASILKRPVPPVILVLDSPLGAWFGVRLFSGFGGKNNVRQQVGQQVEQQVRQQVEQQVGQQVEQQVRQQVEQQVGQQVRQQVWQQVWQQVRQQVWQQVRQQVEQQVGQQVRQQVRQQVGQQVEQQVRQQVEQQFIWPYIDGHWTTGYFSWADFHKEIGVTGYSEAYAVFRRCADFGLFYPLDEVCIISDRPSTIFKNRNGLHRDGGAALSYPDGWSVWALNGVRVPQQIAESPAEQIDPRLILKESNVEIRREIVRKIGVERMLWKLGSKQLSKDGDYELHELQIGQERTARALKMLNPSVPELWHVEFVPPTVKTVQEALNFRNGLSPEMIDENSGADWFQQGDLIIRPSGKTKFKSRPSVLT